MDINRCSNCGLALIDEEIPTHECKDVLDYRFEDDILWMFDGKIWYPRKLTDQPKGNTDTNNREGTRA